MTPKQVDQPTDQAEPHGAAQATRCGIVALIGRPNAGKSTILNSLVGEKISIVTHKVQTTRFRIRAIALIGPAQIIFVDTPGIFAPRRRLDRAMVDSAWAGAGDADTVAVIVDAAAGANASPGDGQVAGHPVEDDLLATLKRQNRRAILVLNKIDLIPRPKLLGLAAVYNEGHAFERTFMVSATTGEGLDDLARHLAQSLPEGPWLYPEDQVADVPLRLMAAEVTREKLILLLHQELPYRSTVETDQWTEHKDGAVRIDQTIFVGRPGHKGIVLGKGGQMLKRIGQAARAELEGFLGVKVHLFIHVKVREKWDSDPERYRALGLDFPKD